MVEVTHNTEISHPIPKAKLIEALLKANGFFPHVLSPGVLRADSQEKISVEGRLHRTVRATVNANPGSFLYNHSTVERDEQGNISKEISHEVTIEAWPYLGVGSVCKYAGRYFTVGQVDITEEQIIKAMREKASVMFGAIQAYSAAKPQNPFEYCSCLVVEGLCGSCPFREYDGSGKCFVKLLYFVRSQARMKCCRSKTSSDVPSAE
ncbi:hypothetical protein EUGRSUZ_A00130 [Eucalyptus grandis]|uniref:Uncharacterized protein n=2 Tax=Eucalyptus grandis TaxID=71139 RepID=A0ACC3M0I1_EUCGR|nr:hypothetical protein EUGRSUZ_A00130 [Eucalyptus grandis]